MMALIQFLQKVPLLLKSAKGLFKAAKARISFTTAAFAWIVCFSYNFFQLINL
jgi:hypothetical protein